MLLRDLPVEHDNVHWSWISGDSLAALTFVFILCPVPLMLIYFAGKGFTRTRVLQTIVFFLWLVGGLILFTSYIEFTSSHDYSSYARTLTPAEAVYFIAQIVTTVGYGDLNPAHEGGQIVIGTYVLVTLFIIANMISEVVKMVREYSNSVADRMAITKVKADDPHKTQTAQEQVHRWLHKEVPDLCWKPIATSAAVYLAFVVAGTLFFHLYPGEGKTVAQGIYMSVITLSSVGFGAVTPVTQAGMVFGAYWMLFGVASLVAFVGSFGVFLKSVKEREDFNPAQQEADFSKLVESLHTINDGMIDKYEFVKLCLMNSRHLHVTIEEVGRIERSFRMLGPDAKGLIDPAQLLQSPA